MDIKRLTLISSLFLVGMLLWQAWQDDYGGDSGNLRPKTIQDQGFEQTRTDIDDLPDQSVRDLLQEEGLAVTRPNDQEAHGNDGQGVMIKTDLMEMDLDLQGGTIRELLLLDYPVDKAKPDVPLALLKRGQDLYMVQSGLLSEQQVPDHSSFYTAEKRVYDMGDGDELTVDLFWQSEQGIRVTKRLLFRRGSYLVDLFYQVENRGETKWTGSSYGQIQRTEPERESMFIYTYTGAVISSPEKRYQKVSFEDIREKTINEQITNGWIAMLQHYFISAFIPVKNDENYHYYTKYIPHKERYLIGAISAPIEIAPGESKILEQRLYLGPKIQETLSTVADGLDLTVDYGMLWFIAKPLFWFLNKIHTITGNWGWAIVILTILIKLVFYYPSALGYRSLANMRRVQPRLLAVRERYKKDRQRLNQAMMEIYKKEKINPLGGCFPILIQIPVFISLYWMLLESVEMRQADFAWWINDLSSPDRYYILPLIMGITMYIQQKLNPAPMDPVQQKVMSFLPFVFTIFFTFFPSGLVLYWVVNNILSIIQQWVITRRLEGK